jgi:hypothetical protein
MKYTSKNILLVIVALLIGTSCQGKPLASQTIQLATSAENKVQVGITLNSAENGQAILSATFTPENTGLHLYSKDTPKTGIDGLGRPTLLELSKNSSMLAIGELIESIPPLAPITPPLELLIYPAGPITLSLRVMLPKGNDWIDDEVIVTYMACDEQGCRPPVQQKSIPIKIPGQKLFHP